MKTSQMFPFDEIETFLIFKKALDETNEGLIFESFINVSNLKFLLSIKQDTLTFPHTEEFKKVWDIYLISCYKKGYEFDNLYEHFFKIPLQKTYSYDPLDMVVCEFYKTNDEGYSYLI